MTVSLYPLGRRWLNIERVPNFDPVVSRSWEWENIENSGCSLGTQTNLWWNPGEILLINFSLSGWNLCTISYDHPIMLWKLRRTLTILRSLLDKTLVGPLWLVSSHLGETCVWFPMFIRSRYRNREGLWRSSDRWISYDQLIILESW